MKSLNIIWVFILFAVINTSAQNPAQTIPSFSFKRVDKREFTNKDIQAGKLLFFVFFDTECDHCQRSIQFIGQHYNEFKKTVLYLITLDSAEKVKPFMNKYGAGINNKKNVLILQDTRNEFIQKFGPRKYPSLFLYSAKKELIMYEDNEQNLPGFIKKINSYGK
jgi:peroxiredoxin